MKKVAKYFGKDVLAQVSEEKVIKHLPEVRKFAGDREMWIRDSYYRAAVGSDSGIIGPPYEKRLLCKCQ